MLAQPLHQVRQRALLDGARERVEDRVIRLARTHVLEALAPNDVEAFHLKYGYGLGDRVQSISAAIVSLESNLESIRPNLVAKQLAAANILAKSLKLNIGARYTYIDGWLGIDVLPAQLLHTVEQIVALDRRDA